MAISLRDYYDQLLRHDFDFESSDDPGVWDRSFAEHLRLMKIAEESPAHAALWEAFRAHHRASLRRCYDKTVSVPPLPERPSEAPNVHVAEPFRSVLNAFMK